VRADPAAARAPGGSRGAQDAPAAPPLGEILVASKVLAAEDLDKAMAVQQHEGGPLGEILIKEQLARPVEVAQALRTQHGARQGGPGAAPEAAAAPSAADSIRVRVNLLDRLMTLAGELVLGRNQLLQKLSGVTDEIAGLNSLLHTMDRVTSELQEAVMQTRMQPLSGLFSRFHRVIRDLARSLGKKIELTVEGETVELDKTLIEALTDPLTHLIRNCADHGIEKPAERRAGGKRETGTVSLAAYHEGGRVYVRVSDDGAGVNIERVKDKAVEKSLITREAAAQMSDREVLRLLFMPGFTTAEQVTGVSGRGVGMDVVLRNIQNVGGTVEIVSDAGKGTTFLLALPLTLAIIPALIVSAARQRFAIPQANLVELVYLEGEDAENAILNVRGSEVYTLRGEMLPLVRMDRVLGMGAQPVLDAGGGDGAAPQPAAANGSANGGANGGANSAANGSAKGSGNGAAPHAEAQDAARESAHPPQGAAQDARRSLSVVVMAAGTSQFGLAVERVFDTEEIVVQPLSNLLKDVGIFAGATLMGDGQAALILDIAGLMKAAELSLDGQGPDDALVTRGEAEVSGHEDDQTILLFNINRNEPMAVPLTIISRLETVQAADIRSSIHGKVIPYRDKMLPLIFLEEHAQIAPPPAGRETLKVLVFEIEKPVGLVVTEIIDSLEIAVAMDDSALTPRGFSGLAMVNGQPTAFLDIYQVIELAYPNWFQQDKRRREAMENKDAVRLLLVEDSAFYRNMEKSYLAQDGFHVIEAENGRQALELLRREPVHLVITDIEMPELNGFALAEAIRADEALRHLPIIAVTSLTQEEERRRGMEAGMDAYLIKLQREVLLKEVHRLLAQRRALN
jgi:two-component system, chemotaxis family, sensor kinase CheA